MIGVAQRPWFTLAAALASALVVVVGFGWAARHIGAGIGDDGTRWLELGFTLALFGALAAIGLVGMSRTGGIAGLRSSDALRPAAIGMAIGAVMLLVAFLYARLAGVAVPVPAAIVTGAGWIALGSVAVIVQAGAEELFFRGWLQRALGRDWPATAALLVSALAFAVLHLVGGTRAPLALLNIFLAGAVFALLAERAGGLVAAIGAHIAYNWTETLALGLDPNPGTGSFGAIWNFDLVGPALWGGSSEGLNASVGLTLTLVAVIIPLVWLPQRLRMPVLG